MIFDSREQYLQRERDRLERYRTCDHEAGDRRDRTMCKYCCLPENEWDSPEDSIEDDALDLSPSDRVSA